MRQVEIRVLLVGPTSPPYAGVETATESLLIGLASTPGVVWRHLNTRKPVPNARRGTLNVMNLAWALRHIVRMMWACLWFSPDIVHMPVAHNRLGFMRDVCLVSCARLTGARVLLQAHNDSYDKFVATQPRLFRSVIIAVFRRAAAIAVQGESLRSQFQNLGLGARVTILSNHLEVERFRRARMRQKANGGFRVLLLGRVSVAKGALDLALAAVQASHRLQIPIELVFTGETVSQDASVAHLAHRSADVPVLIERALQSAPRGAVRVSYVGVLDREATLRELSSADVLALPSYSEALPYAVLEGAAAGLPILASEVGMIAELRSRGLRGEFVPPGDVQAIASALVSLTDPKRRVADGLSNTTVVEREFDQALLPSRLGTIYRGIMEGR